MSITKTTNTPEVGETAVKVMEFNAEDTLRFLKIREEIAEMDERIALKYARREGQQDVLIKLVKKGVLTVSQAAEEADMTVEEFEALMAECG